MLINYSWNANEADQFPVKLVCKALMIDEQNY